MANTLSLSSGAAIEHGGCKENINLTMGSLLCLQTDFVYGHAYAWLMQWPSHPHLLLCMDFLQAMLKISAAQQMESTGSTDSTDWLLAEARAALAAAAQAAPPETHAEVGVLRVRKGVHAKVS